MMLMMMIACRHCAHIRPKYNLFGPSYVHKGWLSLCIQQSLVFSDRHIALANICMGRDYHRSSWIHDHDDDKLKSVFRCINSLVHHVKMTREVEWGAAAGRDSDDRSLIAASDHQEIEWPFWPLVNVPTCFQLFDGNLTNWWWFKNFRSVTLIIILIAIVIIAVICCFLRSSWSLFKISELELDIDPTKANNGI